MKLITSHMRRTAENISEKLYWETLLLKNFGLIIKLEPKVQDSFWIIRNIYNTLKSIPPNLIKECGIKNIIIRDDMGPSRPYYPNHGYFIHDEVNLNENIFRHPDEPEDFYDHKGYFLSRPQQTILHEFGHGYDAYHDDLSLQSPWLCLSGWSYDPKPGLQKLHIKEKGVPEVIGEMYYDPKAEFTRFYAKRNSYDDWADCFSFYVAGMRNKVPQKKCDYFDKLLVKYY